MASKLLELLVHPKELAAAVQVKRQWKVQDAVVQREATGESYKKCYEFLNMTSRSFARVIRALDSELRHPICIFYLVLRGLDTIEDDMSLAVKQKTLLLSNFHKRLYERGWTCDEIGLNEKDRPLLVEFDAVIEEFCTLRKEYRDVISDVAQRMAEGMIKYSAKTVHVLTMPDYNLYTHYVAGLVGYGLVQLFIASGLEPELALLEPATANRLSNSMGLFLQKVNIIKDVREDFQEGRWFWPKEIWGSYVLPLLQLDYERVDSKQFNDFSHLKKTSLYPSTIATDYKEEYVPDKQQLQKVEACVPDSALGVLLNNPTYGKRCVQELCIDALKLLPDCMQFLSLLQNDSVRRFCAIPQLMALATFSLFFENDALFSTRGLKIRRGTTAWIFTQSTAWSDIIDVFELYLQRLSLQNADVYICLGRDAKSLDKSVAEKARSNYFNMVTQLGRTRAKVARYKSVLPKPKRESISRFELKHVVFIFCSIMLSYLIFVSMIPQVI